MPVTMMELEVDGEVSQSLNSFTGHSQFSSDSSLDDFTSSNAASGLNFNYEDFEVDSQDKAESKEELEKEELEFEWSPINDFFADSPYFDAFVEKEMFALGLVTSTLEDIGKRTTEYASAGSQMAKATRRLSTACRLRTVGDASEKGIELKKKALGEETYNVLNRVGEVLAEIANAQENLNKFVEAFLGSQLKDSAVNEIHLANRLRQEAKSQTKLTEKLFFKYLNGKQAGGNYDSSNNAVENTSVSDQVPLKSLGIASRFRQNFSEELAVTNTQPKIDKNSSDWRVTSSVKPSWKQILEQKISRGETDNEAPKAFRLSKGKHGERTDEGFFKDVNTKLSGSNMDPSDDENKTDDPDPALQGSSTKLGFALRLSRNFSPDSRGSGASNNFIKAIKIAKWKQTLKKIQMEQANAELKRVQLSKHILDTKCHRTFELSHCSAKMLREMHSYFNICTDLLEGIIPSVRNLEEKSENMLMQHQNTKMEVWEERESSINKLVIESQKSADEAHHESYSIARTDPSMLSPSVLSLEEAESEVEIWDLPTKLATSSRYHRAPPSGVLLEGWLYEKNSPKIMSMHSSWTRRWFMLKDDGIYCLKMCSEFLRSENNKWIAKVKLCDIATCNVRPLADEPAARFCFELIMSDDRAIILQARGPHEFALWINEIRSAIENIMNDSSEVSTYALEVLQKVEKYEEKKTKSEAKKKKDPLADEKQDIHDKEEKVEIKEERKEEVIPQQPKPKEPKARSRKKDAEFNISKIETTETEEEGSTSTVSTMTGANDIWMHTDPDNMSVIGRSRNPLIQNIVEVNPTCADCGTACPDWASLTLGILVCFECSRVHRSNGVHMKKLRAASVSDSDLSLLLSLGNERVNKIYEKGIQKQKLGFTDKKEREEWIKSKYVKKEFLGDVTKDGEELSRCLYDAVKEGDVVGVATALAHGASMDWKNQQEQDMTALELSALRKQQGEDFADECNGLLIQNGAKVGCNGPSLRQVLLATGGSLPQGLDPFAVM